MMLYVSPRRERSLQQNPVSCVSVSTQTASEDQASTLWDELSLVGLPDAIDVQALLDLTGSCWAHHRCVEWSLGTCQTEDPAGESVDRAVVSGSTERCAFCKHLGATIRCCEDQCPRTYHYPCAAGAGTFQDSKRFFLLCPEHIDRAPERSKEGANCAVCDSPGDLLDQFFCTTCGQHYHGMCLDIAVTPLKRAGWQCPECKVCQNCKQSGEDSKMLVCDTCDKGYHTFCLQPVMKSVPTNGWRCKNCRICVECGTRTSSQWHHNCLVCDSCYQQQDNLCPLCGKCYHPEVQEDALHCNMCRRWVHLECDKPTDHELDSQVKEEYICMYCKHLAAETGPLQPGDDMLMAEFSTDYSNEMEVEGTEDHEIYLTQIVSKDVCVPEPAPGIVPDAVPVHTGEQQRSQSPEHPDTRGLLTSASSQDKMNSELENKISHEVDSDKIEITSKVMHVCDEDQNGNKMEVTENVEIFDHQIIVQQEELDSSERANVTPAEEPRPPGLTVESVTIPLDALVSPLEQSGTSCPEEQLVMEEALDAERKENSEAPAPSPSLEMTPPMEGGVKDGSREEDRPVTLPSDTEPALGAAAEVSKARASSSPPLPPDPPSHDVLHSFPPALSASVGSIMPTTYISVTPKIGMGKPAISKRKFSPGRPRSKQGAWSTHSTVSPPSWSPDISEGRELFKPRQLPGSAIWSIKVGRGSGFPGKRRPRGAGLSGRGGRGRSKLKSGLGTVMLPGVSAADASSTKDDEESSMHNTVVLFSSSDKFTLHQDMCVVCGSFGQGVEGRLLACSQCGQCYHPYCVSIKISRVVLSKGWRCLECTVCEACGKATDPGRLLLCDDCDISYHTYCLDPPLQTVPKGGWKCKWCVWCRHCGATSAGLRGEWQNNYTQCAPCASLASCPVCGRGYREDDLILQCRQCDRWTHAACQSLSTEEEVESVADLGFDCSMCRPYMPTSNVPSSDCCDSSLVAQIITKVRELDPPKTYTQDGVCLTESGMTQLQSLTVAVPRRKRCKPKLKLKIINQNSVAVLQTPPDFQSEHSRDGEMDDTREGELMDCEGKSESSPEREAAGEETKGGEGAEGVKKRKRKPYRPGIGGFMVRQRSRTGQGKTKKSVIRKDSSGSISEQLPGRDDGWNEHLPNPLADDSISVTENTEKIKKRYRKRKNKLEETFPAYLQEAFFGKDLLDTSRQHKLNADNLSEDPAPLSYPTGMSTSFLDPLEPLLSSSSTPAKPAVQGAAEDPLADISEVLSTDDDILGIISDDLAQSVDESARIDIGPISEGPSSLPQPIVHPSSRSLSEEQLDGLLSPELDKMVTDGAILGKLYKIPELGGKDVEDLFTAVLSPVTPQPTALPQPALGPSPQLLPLHSQDVFPRIPLMNGLIGPGPHIPHSSLPPGNGLGAFPPYPDASTWVSSTPNVEGESDTLSNAQRSTLKWEKEEALGDMATVAPVLYTNINFPSLKEEFPDWTTRVKQIAKLWRKASSQERAPYVQKARDNRAALRINKVQMSNDSMKRQQQQDSIDPGSRMDSDLFKDPLKQRESEHEQEWKFRQQMRQKSKQQAKIEATQKLEQVKSEQQQQQQQQQQQAAPAPHAPPGPATPGSGIQGPLAPQPASRSMSPAQSFHKDLFTKPPPSTLTAASSSSSSSSSSSDDVFVKPQAPPPPGPPRISVPDNVLPPPATRAFSPGTPSSRPRSPLDPYVKMVGTPRPGPPAAQGFARRGSGGLPEACSTLGAAQRPSDTAPRPSCAASTTDPYAQPPDTPRPLGAEPRPAALGPTQPPLLSEHPAPGPAAPTSDRFPKPQPRADAFQRQRLPDPYARPLLTPALPDSGPFKAPLQPPPAPSDPYSSASQAPRRLPLDPYERPALTPRPADSFPHGPASDPYSQPPRAPCPAGEPFAHPARAFPPPRPAAQDPYAQPPGTPRPAPEPYSQLPGPPHTHLDPYAQPPGTPRPLATDPYSQHPPTPRPAPQPDMFGQSTAGQRHPEAYAHPPGTPRPGTSAPYPLPPAAPRPRTSEGYSRPSASRPGLMPTQDPFLPAAQLRGPALPRPPDGCAQGPRPPGPSLSDAFSPSATRDPYDQPPMTPRPQPDSFGSGQGGLDSEQPRSGADGSLSAPSNSPRAPQGPQFPGVAQLPTPTGPEAQRPLNMSPAEAEKLRQRQKLREIILQQQQQKKMANRQDRSAQEPAAAPHPGALQHWQPEAVAQPFTRPPPPYPGSLRAPAVPPLGPRYAMFPKDSRGPYPPEVSVAGLRPHGFRFGFPGGGPAALPSQERFLVPPQQMQGPRVPPQLRRSSSDMPRPLSSSQMSAQAGLPQHFPPQGLPLQQHNILGQAFIELRHRAPDGRPRPPFPAAPPGGLLEPPAHPRHGGFLHRPDFPAPRPAAEPLRRPPPGLASQPPAHAHLDPRPPAQQEQGHSAHAAAAVLVRPLGHPLGGDFPEAPLPAPAPAAPEGLQLGARPPDGLEEKLDPDDPSVKDLDVKDLEGVEVKDLDDDDLENLNLDAEDGKGDELDTLASLETNDPNLEDLLRAGEFDLIAYTDPELDLGDKKSAFSEELDLGVPVGEKLDHQCAPTEPTERDGDGDDDGAAPGDPALWKQPDGAAGEIKTEAPSPKPKAEPRSEAERSEEGRGDPGTPCHQASALTDTKEGGRTPLPAGEAKRPGDDAKGDAAGSGSGSGSDRAPGAPQLPAEDGPGTCGLSSSTPVLSGLLAAEKPDGSDARPLGSPPPTVPASPSEPAPSLPPPLMTPPGPVLDSPLAPGVAAVSRASHAFPQAVPVPPGFLQSQPAVVTPGFGAGNPAPQPGPPLVPPLPLAQQGRERPLLLEEQPLLLQDLLDQERQEQQQQRQMQAMIRQRSEPSFFPNFDFDAITDPIMKAKMVALKGINKVMVQNSMGMPPMVMSRFPFMGQGVTGAQNTDGQSLLPQATPQDGSITHQISRPNPPNFGPGFVNDSQRKQYEEWLQETQQLLQMQQKYLEEKIGAHRKCKKALSAKQRTAKKAGREFPEEDAEQLKHVTEQQNVVQKQLEQIRKQQKEHAELMEDYRLKQQQQCALGGQPQAPLAPGPAPPGFPLAPHPPHPGVLGAHVGPVRAPSLPAWRPPGPPAHLPLNPPAPQMPMKTCTPAPGAVPSASPQGGPPPRVQFEDNNPFSEGFQERERQERLREQGLRLQLLRDADRHRALQQGLPAPPLPFCGAPDLPRDILQPPQHPPGPLGSPPAQAFLQSAERRPPGPPAFLPDAPDALPAGGPGFHSAKQGPGGTHSFQQPPTLPPGPPALPAAPPVPGSTVSCGQDPGATPSLIQLYSDIIPEEKGKRKRTRKRKKEEDVESTKTPSTPHSDSTAPPTPSVSEATSTPTRSTPSEPPLQGDPEAGEPAAPPCAEVDSKPPAGDFPQTLTGPEAGEPVVDTPPTAVGVKLEVGEPEPHLGPEGPLPGDQARSQVGDSATAPLSTDQSPPQPNSGPPVKGDSGNELLKHLLKNKKAAALLNQKPGGGLGSEDDGTKPGKPVGRQSPAEGLPSLGSPAALGAFGCSSHQSPRAEGAGDTKRQRSRRAQRTAERSGPRVKKRKKDEEEKQPVYSHPDSFPHLKQLSLLPLMEPIIGVNFAHFLPYGSGQCNSGSRLLGAFGSATLDGVSDYYSQLIYKQNNLSNPPTPPASLPPTPPPMTCQKMANGFATTEELAGKAGVFVSHEVTKGLGPKPFPLQLRPHEDLLARAITQGPKTVDIPASLPTPPHSNQEDLRVQEHTVERDTPDSFVPSSSPESVVGTEVRRYPDLSLVKEEPPEPVPSPTIPLLPSGAGKGSESRRKDVQAEPGALFFTPPFGSSPNGPRSGLISVAITLHPTAAENISSVVAAFSDLLHVRVPSSYEVSRAPDVPSVGLVSGHRGNPGTEYRQHVFLRGPPPGSAHPPRLASSHRLKQPTLPFPPVGNGLPGYKDPAPGLPEGPALRPQWCCHCKVVILGSGVWKSFRDLAFAGKESREHSSRVEKDIVFCSNNCFVLYTSTTQVKDPGGKDPAPPQSPLTATPPRAAHQYSANTSSLDVHRLPAPRERPSPPASPPPSFPLALEAAHAEARPDELKVTVKLKPRPRAVPGGLDEGRPLPKKWRGLRWRKWSPQAGAPRGPCPPPGEAEPDAALQQVGTPLRPEPAPRDGRRCCFCHEEGDGRTDGPARLLNLDLDLWVHLNCALWSTEVYETQAGALMNVELALRRGLQVKCASCHRPGATSGCHRFRCANVYHFPCATRVPCMFFKDKTLLCPAHRPKGLQEQELSDFAVFRRVYVQRDEVRQIAGLVQRGERQHTLRVGSLIFHALGQLPPRHMAAFHSPSALFPVGYEASRLYWSTRHPHRRCRYLCSIAEQDGRPLFLVRVLEQGHEDLVLSGSSPKGVWDKILEPVACARKKSQMLQLFPAYLKGEDLFGLTVSAVARIAESLPGVEACERYSFRYGRNPLMELPLAVNPSGCARCEPRMSAHVKRFVLRPHTLNSTSTSKSFQSTVTGELNAPYSKQFVHSKSSQYRRMKSEWKSNVYLARSRIQGLGLYAARDMEKHTMVIEYIGTVIRNEVANRKEKLYESQNRGVYMFRMDNDHVIDATLTGGPARYINHSCAPNCVAEVVTFERGHKIIISSSRRIQKGEELCYDYKFDFEDDQHKIPCHCGAVNCRKWMN
ncbi:histone-lysine N-methyltransferase 2C isoform X2 [Erinaceus europaeus]|uniref:[histone H3]-lysine(4) N-methyltransferase n=1 Tax=Erinaceus europaeus TaxID=9365 RepID=A0ABM3XVF5_ERIEU|nr:histone-lysine N-methyltransferase 2C isoform X2 [Erinaceus europaeus]